MASGNDRTPIRTLSIGRGFASLDPERQCEIPGGSLRTACARAPAHASRPVATWMRVQAERDLAMFEGSSSRRSR